MKIPRNRLLLKSVAIFFILEALSSTVLPTISWALTSGPTAPEATSFEPVDTTDMVNLATGDLAYNIPLIEVPGPSGGYPMSLSYHAGIQPNEDASWVGLGWTLNPGAIVRNVNGFADDQQNQGSFSRYFWEGGNTETYSIGVSVGLAGSPASVSGGLSFSQDTYQGSGVGIFLGVGAGIGGAKSPFGLGAQVGISPFGEPYASAGLNLSAPLRNGEKSTMGLTGGISLGVQTDFKSVGYYGSAGLSASYSSNGHSDNASLLGVSMSTGNKGMATNVSVAGASFGGNSASSSLSTSSSGFSMPVPIWYGVWLSLGYNYQRYWIDETDNFVVNGALYYPQNTSELTTHYFDDKAYDTYSLSDPNLEGGIVDNPEPDKVMGGSFPNFDNYAVHAQGLFGNMRPYYFQRHLYKRNNYGKDSEGDRAYQTIQYDISKANSGERNMAAEFRFINDFSNRFEFSSGQVNQNGTNPLGYSFSDGTDLKIGETASTSYSSNQIQGSRYINWFTNSEIIAKKPKVVNSGFIETVSTGFVRNTPDPSDDENVGGFVIVNESGVKYHFALPAYSYAEYMYSENKTGPETFNEVDKPAKYAYTWYLTAITGPDYVDRGPNGATGDGKLNQYDWGYWVEFEYGKWSDHYGWRNPSEGMATDIDGKFQNFSEGIKEVYYLDAIRTKSHTALFFKEIRHDAKGTLNFYRDIARGESNTSSTVTKWKLIDDKTKVGMFTPTSTSCSCNKSYKHVTNPHTPAFYDIYADKGTLNYRALPTSSLKLNSIVIISNEDLAQSALDKSHGSSYAQSSTFNWAVTQNDLQETREQCDFSPITIDYHLYQNVYDIDDLNQSTGIAGKAIRKIDLQTDYSLSPETSNSFDFNLVKASNPSENSNDYPRYGKLTLTGVKFLGKESLGGDILPPIKFNYDSEDQRQEVGYLTVSSGTHTLQLNNSALEAGEIIRFSETCGSGDCKTYYALVSSRTGDLCTLRFLGKNIPSSSNNIVFGKTKNPPYNKDAYDKWGLYKSDFNLPDIESNSPFSRFVTDISAKSVDAWSLRTIKTPTGATINISYEPDSYTKPVLNLGNNLSVEKVEKLSAGESQIVVTNTFSQLNQILKPGMSLDYTFVFADLWNSYESCSDFYDGGFDTNLLDGQIVVTSVELVANKWVIKTSTDLEKFYRIKPLVQEACVGGYYTREYKTPLFIAGNISVVGGVLKGGGLRVTGVAVRSMNRLQRTNYNVASPASGSVGQTSGVTSFEPDGISQIEFHFPAAGDPKKDYFYLAAPKENLQKAYKKAIHKNFEKIVLNSREVPSPGVMYKYVTVSESTIQDGVEEVLPNYSTYEFEVFQSNDVEIKYENDASTTFSQKKYEDYIKYSKKESRNVTIKDYTARIGTLKKVTLYDANGTPISETVNEYLHDSSGDDNSTYENQLANNFNSQGVIEETFSDSRFIRRDGTDFSLQGVISKRESFPAIQVSQSSTNFKTGITTKVENRAFDYYSGQVASTVSMDGYGNLFLVESKPAYRINEYAAMGQGASGGKNMLTQIASSHVYKIDSDENKVGLVGASIQTWSDKIPGLESGKALHQNSNQLGIWRKHANYSFVGGVGTPLQKDGLYPVASVTAFNAWNRGTSANDEWQMDSELTLYSVNSSALESIDLNGQYLATKMSFDQSRVIASVKNAEFKEFGFSGGENRPADNLFGFDVRQDGEADAPIAHTGKKAITAAPNHRAFTFYMVPNQRTYRVSVWSSQPTCKIGYILNASSPANAPVKHIGQAGNWHLLEADITVSAAASQLEIWCEAGTSTTYFDDFRISPVDAIMKSYVYNEWGELWFTLDNNNLFVEYKYDEFGKLKRVFKESFQNPRQTMSEYKYRYANQK